MAFVVGLPAKESQKFPSLRALDAPRSCTILVLARQGNRWACIEPLRNSASYLFEAPTRLRGGERRCSSRLMNAFILCDLLAPTMARGVGATLGNVGFVGLLCTAPLHPPRFPSSLSPSLATLNVIVLCNEEPCSATIQVLKKS